ncbi:MAG: dimethylsulfonioproprionate lyase family protein [Rhodobacter sp.]|nr:dimethylsulfonioproprionate lyase family protein [Rhodobacter sp.]
MTRAVWDHLLEATRSAHAAHPRLGAFTRFAPDLSETHVEPHRIPAASLFEADDTLTSSLAQAFRAASPLARWRETYKHTAIGDDFLNRFGCYCLIGKGGAFQSAEMSAYMVYMPPDLWYPWHHHPGEEIYCVLDGEAEFLRDGHASETLGPGGTSQHCSNQPHATRTRDHSVLALVLWRSHLTIPPVLTSREVAA